MIVQKLLTEIQNIANRSEDDLQRVNKRSTGQLAINGAFLTFFLYQFFNNENLIFFVFTIIPLIISSVYCIKILLPYVGIRMLEIEINRKLTEQELESYYYDHLLPYYIEMHSQNVKINQKLVPYLRLVYFWFLATFIMMGYMAVVSFFLEKTYI